MLLQISTWLLIILALALGQRWMQRRPRLVRVARTIPVTPTRKRMR